MLAVGFTSSEILHEMVSLETLSHGVHHNQFPNSVDKALINLMVVCLNRKILQDMLYLFAFLYLQYLTSSLASGLSILKKIIYPGSSISVFPEHIAPKV